jgi:tetratricopeptide (TPR) repeat protein
MKSRPETPPLPAWAVPTGATRWTGGRWIARVTLGSILLVVGGYGIGLLATWLRQFSDPLSAGRRAYDQGDWAAAAQAARSVLKLHHDDPAALRLLARSSVQLGRDDAALGIYTRRLDAKLLQAEDYLHLGVALKRRGRVDGAIWAWNTALKTEPIAPRTLDELITYFYTEAVENETPENLRPHPLDAAEQAAERLRRQPGWESRGDLMLGIVRGDNRDFTGASEAFRRMLDRDPNAAESNAQPVKLRKLFARTFLGAGRPAEARPHLQAILAGGPDAEASWLLSRVYLQQGAIAEAQQALAHAGSYRRDKPLEDEPSPYVGEARCQSCHAAIFRDSLANPHTQTFHRAAQLPGLPRPDRPLADPADPKVTHAIKEIDGSLWEETRVGDSVLRSLIQYAFGTSDRYLTMVSRDASDQYRMGRLSYYHTADGQGWDRTFLAVTDPKQPEDFQGETIAARADVTSCLHCHITNPGVGRERIGPETADRAIGCERCHGPGGNHLAAVAAGFSDRAIVNPASASPQAVSREQCNDCHILDPRYRQGDRENAGWVRSQGVGWTWSRCNTESGGALGCVTCHDPHKGVHSATTADYEAKCLACHSATTPQASAGPRPVAQTPTERRATVCSVDQAKGCIKCHMPGVRMDLSHRDFTDHYIRVPPAKATRRPEPGSTR